MNDLLALGLILMIELVVVGCERRESARPTARPARTAGTAPATGKGMAPKVEVKVLSDGSLLVDGQGATLETLDRRLGELARANGVVWYYRESGESEPPAAAARVIELVLKHGLRVSLSSKADFSDVIDDKGGSRPRR